ncbi:MAG: carbohydrate binding family 9 domain-containing protein [Acidobacteria bacterium]|nr:carbohydrate binding family 9 domain-containing protein [Acidobacteriota bacterium]
MRVICVAALALSLAAAATAAANERPKALGDDALRSPDGRLQVTAARATTPPKIDGTLDDELWLRAEPVSGFVQAEPQEGKPASEPTEVRLAYDAQNLYIAAYCYDREPDALVVNDIRKDFQNGEQDTFEVIIDTFGDRRNGYVFMTNPAGARGDRQVSGEGRETNASWDAVWFVRARRVADGWTAEMAIPFKSLRFKSGEAHAWGINFSRRIRRKNEVDYWSPVPRAYELTRISLAGNLAGLSATTAGRNLRIKPYVLGSAVRPTGGEAYDGTADVGFDLKYGVTPALTLDVTFRPDFAQAEADEQQVNLTQFSQFYPEKRDFFLENSGIFYVGDAARNNRRVDNINPTPDTDMLLFFSRRIGLTPAGTPIPIVGGGRLTGRVGGLSIGALSLQTRRTGATPANNYTVLRVRQNVFRAGDIGAIYMSRQATDGSGGYNRVYGIDSYLRLFGNLDLSTFAVKTETPGLHGGDYAVRASYNWEGNFYHNKGGFMTVGRNFNNDLGYYRRIDTRKWFIDTGLRPRPKWFREHGVKELHPHILWNYYTNQQGQVTGKSNHNGFTFFFHDGGSIQPAFNQRYEVITRPLRLHPKAPAVPAGSYAWNEYNWSYKSNMSLPIFAEVSWTYGGLWSGTQRSLSATVTLRPHYRFWIETQMRRTAAKLDLPRTKFVRNLWTMRTNYSFTTNMFFDSLLQYDRDLDQLNANVRFNFIHRPLSDLFIVFNESRFMTSDADTPGRGIIVKFTRMMTF